MKYILIVWLATGGNWRPAITSIEFNNKSACLAALASLQATPPHPVVGVYGTCVAKGLPQ